MAGQLRGSAACRFADRCPSAMAKCLQEQLGLFRTEPQRAVACFLYEDAPTLQAERMEQVLQRNAALSAVE